MCLFVLSFVLFFFDHTLFSFFFLFTSASMFSDAQQQQSHQQQQRKLTLVFIENYFEGVSPILEDPIAESTSPSSSSSNASSSSIHFRSSSTRSTPSSSSSFSSHRRSSMSASSPSFEPIGEFIRDSHSDVAQHIQQILQTVALNSSELKKQGHSAASLCLRSELVPFILSGFVYAGLLFFLPFLLQDYL